MSGFTETDRKATCYSFRSDVKLHYKSLAPLHQVDPGMRSVFWQLPTVDLVVRKGVDVPECREKARRWHASCLVAPPCKRWKSMLEEMMTKPISRPMHGLLTDYPYVALVSTAPNSVGFTDDTTAARLCRTLSAGILLSSLLTQAEWGLFRVMPYKAHLALDTAAGVFSLGAPWLFGFADNKRARNTFLVMGAFGLMAGLLSEPEEMPHLPVDVLLNQ